uniref:Jacalin-type lectin domain-containing protein n=1 Tax=Oryza glumipatula TaxID=40148 RepID=A0A0E0AUP3_9ORYZ
MNTVAAVGTFGGTVGTLMEITEAPPKRLASITVYVTQNDGGNARRVCAISFTYFDADGKDHKVGPWGCEITDEVTPNQVNIKGNERVIEISGTADGNIKSLNISTNYGITYPFGDKNVGKEFRIPVHNSAIVGFFALTSGVGLNAVGAYVIPENKH